MNYQDVPFDVVKAQNGGTVVTRIGGSVVFEFYDPNANPDAQVQAFVDGATRMFYVNGTYYQTGPDDESEYDLFIREEI